MGPDEKGTFRLRFKLKFYNWNRNVDVIDIHCKRVSVRSASCGQTCTIAIKLGTLDISNKLKKFLKGSKPLIGWVKIAKLYGEAW